MRLSPRRWIAIAACTVVGVATQLPATAQPAATDQDCEDHWRTSNAAGSCGCASENPFTDGWMVDTSCYYTKAVPSSMNCNVAVDCARSDPQEQPKSNDVVVNLPHFMELNNCDGTLQVGAC